MRCVLALGATLALAHVTCANARAVPDAIEGASLDRKPFSVAAMQGNVVVINFWATWCGPCRAEMPALNQYYRAHRADGLSLIAISMDDASKRRVVAAAASGFDFPVALARETKIPSALRPTQLPATLIFDRRGALRFDSRRSKLPPWDSMSLSRIIGPLLAETTDR
ncbi:MAG: TlpA disulfide reductase family protein [Sphingomonadaceae bacterium]